MGKARKNKQSPEEAENGLGRTCVCKYEAKSQSKSKSFLIAVAYNNSLSPKESEI